MKIFRKMSFADSTGDAIPFYHDGQYHIFSLTPPSGTTVYPERLRTSWSHCVSDDLVHFRELPTAIKPGIGDEPDASGVWTGSVIYAEGRYHAFYTGYCLTARFQQTICHAFSDDGITWEKDPTNPIIEPLIELYEELDWRDPYIFYNDEDSCYWLLISARKLDQPITRRGCVVLYRSKDLKAWGYYGPLYMPGHTNCPECSEMYKMGKYWYLSYSRFSEFGNTIYRISKSPFGPWEKTKYDGIGGRRFYAAKSLQNDEGRRFYFAWAHDRADAKDNGEWYWGGKFCIPHEVVSLEDGNLEVRMPYEYRLNFTEEINWEYMPVNGISTNYGNSLIEMNSCGKNSYGFLVFNEDKFFFKCSILPKETYDFFGILFKSDREAGSCLLLEFDVSMQRVSLLNLPMGVDPFWVASCQGVPDAKVPGPDGVRVCEKTFAIVQNEEISVEAVIDNDMVEIFIDNKAAFTYRSYAKAEFEVGFIVQDGIAEFYDIQVKK